jgi:hypothetical protein
VVIVELVLQLENLAIFIIIMVGMADYNFASKIARDQYYDFKIFPLKKISEKLVYCSKYC